MVLVILCSSGGSKTKVPWRSGVVQGGSGGSSSRF